MKAAPGCRVPGSRTSRESSRSGPGNPCCLEAQGDQLPAAEKPWSTRLTEPFGTEGFHGKENDREESLQERLWTRGCSFKRKNWPGV